MPDSNRLFIAADVSPKVLDALVQVQRTLARDPASRSLRWVGRNQIHITLRFLGEIPPAKTAMIISVLDGVAASFTPFEVEVQGLGFFPNPSLPRVIWAGISQPGRLIALADSVENRVASIAGIADKKFRAHLTLARVGDNFPADQLVQLTAACQAMRNLSFGKILVDKLVLYRSTLHPDGPVYTSLHQSIFSSNNIIGG